MGSLNKSTKARSPIVEIDSEHFTHEGEAFECITILKAPFDPDPMTFGNPSTISFKNKITTILVIGEYQTPNYTNICCLVDDEEDEDSDLQVPIFQYTLSNCKTVIKANQIWIGEDKAILIHYPEDGFSTTLSMPPSIQEVAWMKSMVGIYRD